MAEQGNARRGGRAMLGGMWKAQGGGVIPGRASPFTARGKDRLAWPSRLVVRYARGEMHVADYAERGVHFCGRNLACDPLFQFALARFALEREQEASMAFASSVMDCGDVRRDDGASNLLPGDDGGGAAKKSKPANPNAVRRHCSQLAGTA